MGEGRRKGTGRSRGRGNCGRDVVYDRKRKPKQNKGYSACFSNIRIIQRKLVWSPYKDYLQICELFCI